MSGRDLLLEYAFPIEATEPLPTPSLAYLKQVCIVAKPATGQEENVGEIFECLNMTAVAVRTDNTNAQQSFNAGMSKVYILLADDLNLVEPLLTANTFFTLLISDDFDKDDIITINASLTQAEMTFTALEAGESGNDISIEFLDTGEAGSEVVLVTDLLISVSMEAGTSTAQQIKDALDGSDDASALIATTIEVGEESTAQSAFAEDNLENGAGLIVGIWAGVIGVSSDDVDFLLDQAVITKRTAFFGNNINKAKNMFFAFGELLSDRDWENQQYIEMPFNDGIDELSEAENLFEGKISFVINSVQYGNRLALFTNNRKAIVAPYILEYFEISIQGWGVEYIALNQPAYTIREASLMQDDLQQKAITRFVDSEMVESLSVKISLVDGENFTANGDLTISEPKALWRVNAKLLEVS